MPWANWHLSPYLHVPCSWNGRHISVLYREDCCPPLLLQGEFWEVGELAWLEDPWFGRPHPTGHSLSRRDRESPDAGEPPDRLPKGSDWSQELLEPEEPI